MLPQIRFMSAFTYDAELSAVHSRYGNFIEQASGEASMHQHACTLIELAQKDRPKHASHFSNSQECMCAGPDFSCRETMGAPGLFAAVLGTIAVMLGLFVSSFSLIRRNIIARIVTQPGNGPSRQAMQAGFWRVSSATLGFPGFRDCLQNWICVSL